MKGEYSIFTIYSQLILIQLIETCRNDSSKARIFGSTTSFSLPPSSITTLIPSQHNPQKGSLASLSSLSLAHAAANRSNLLRLTASETAQLELSVETLRDLFWTLYSKLLAVLMGFRVAYDVSARISEVSISFAFLQSKTNLIKFTFSTFCRDENLKILL